MKVTERLIAAFTNASGLGRECFDVQAESNFIVVTSFFDRDTVARLTERFGGSAVAGVTYYELDNEYFVITEKVNKSRKTVRYGTRSSAVSAAGRRLREWNAAAAAEAVARW